MAQQGVDLGADGVGDVDEMVEIGTRHHPDLGDRVWFEAFVGEEFGIGELVTGVGIDRTEGGFTGGEMVGVARIHPIEIALRRLTEDDVGPDLADHTGERFAELEVGHDASIGMPQEVQFGHSDHLGRLGLLASPDLGHLGSGDRVVESTGIAIGHEAVDHLVAGSHEGCSGPGGTEVEVIRVGGNGKDASSHLVNVATSSHDGWMGIMSKSEREEFLSLPHVGVISIAAEGRGPLAVPIWYAYQPGGTVKLLMGADTRKARLIDAAGRFTLCVQRESLPYQYVSVEGPVIEQRPADTEIDSRPMAHRYLGVTMGDAYVEGDSGGSICVFMQPERWSSVDYGKTSAE